MDLPPDSPIDPTTDGWGDLPTEFFYDTESDTPLDTGFDTPLDTLPDTLPDPDWEDISFDLEWEDLIPDPDFEDISFDLEWEDFEFDFGMDIPDDTTEGIIWCVPDPPTNCLLYPYGCCPADRTVVHCYAGFDITYDCLYPFLICGPDALGYMNCNMY